MQHDDGIDAPLVRTADAIDFVRSRNPFAGDSHPRSGEASELAWVSIRRMEFYGDAQRHDSAGAT